MLKLNISTTSGFFTRLLFTVSGKKIVFSAADERRHRVSFHSNAENFKLPENICANRYPFSDYRDTHCHVSAKSTSDRVNALLRVKTNAGQEKRGLVKEREGLYALEVDTGHSFGNTAYTEPE
jgi:hypothetical protein